MVINNTNGTLEVDTGTLSFDKKINTISGTAPNLTLAHGNYVVKSILQLPELAVHPDAGKYECHAGMERAAKIQNESAVNSLSALANVNSNASLTLTNGAQIFTSMTFGNAGAMSVTGGSAFNVTGTNSFNNSGTLTLHTGTIAVAAAQNISNNSNASVVGDGTLNGDVSNSGTLSPGIAPATLGSFTIGGTLYDNSGIVHFKALSATQYDQISVGMSSTFGGSFTT